MCVYVFKSVYVSASSATKAALSSSHSHTHTHTPKATPTLRTSLYVCSSRHASIASDLSSPSSPSLVVTAAHTHLPTFTHTHTHTHPHLCVCVCVYMCLCPSPSPPLLISATTSWHLDGWVCVCVCVWMGPPLLSTLSPQCHFPPLLFCCVARCWCCRSLFFRYSFPAATLSDSSRCLRVCCFIMMDDSE